LVNGLGEPTDERGGGHCPSLATAILTAVGRLSGAPPQGKRGSPLARK
jgi:hypothetical protein